MASLTKKDIQTLLNQQTKELTENLKSYTDHKIGGLKEHMDKKTNQILRSVAKGFQNEHEYMTELITPVKLSQSNHESKFKKLEEALQIKL